MTFLTAVTKRLSGTCSITTKRKLAAIQKNSVEFIPFNGSLIEGRRLIEPFAPRVFLWERYRKTGRERMGGYFGCHSFVSAGARGVRRVFIAYS